MAVVLVFCAAKGWGGGGLLCLLPAMLLVCVLFARRYPGERLLLRWTDARRGVGRRATSARPAPRRQLARVPRGGLLMGFALAVRPPPTALVAS
jgi:hypothetical protein